MKSQHNNSQSENLENQESKPKNNNTKTSRKKIREIYDSIDAEMLGYFTTQDESKILPRRITGLYPKNQRRITKVIKQARFIATLPYIGAFE